MNILDYHIFYLVGIKGVAMTALAQCLLDAGKEVRGWDVTEEFVTAQILSNRRVLVETTHPSSLADVDCLIYTAAHQGPANPLVELAHRQGIPALSHAEALGSIFNQKQGLAVCGVGGKSTTSAMITWILEKTHQRPSFAIGVGNIPGLDKTGQWIADSPYFVAEADEYVVDPAAPSKGEALVPRFSFMQPFVTVCTNLKYDHPDVYRDLEQTLDTYQSFFNQIKAGGSLILSDADRSLTEKMTLPVGLHVEWFGESEAATGRIQQFASSQGRTTALLQYRNKTIHLELSLPGKYNLLNATAAIMACAQVGVEPQAAAEALQSFRSTMRRAEYIGEKHGVQFYDDYAHHPDEIKQVTQAFREWYPQAHLVAAFQSHTFSRTKALFEEFIAAFDAVDEVVMIDIFPSAREAFDESITSDMVCEAINQRAGTTKARNLHDLSQLANYLSGLPSGTVCLTLGAGDIYHVHDMVKA